MATIPVNSQGIMKASTPERSPILPFLQTLFLLGSFFLSHLWPPTTTLSLVFLHSPTQNPYAMPRERGKYRRGPLYYNSLSRCNRLDPSHLALITTSTPDPSQNWLEPPQQPLPPPSNPTMDFGSFPVKEETPPPEEHTPPLSFHPEITPLRVHTQVHGFGTGGCIVEEEIPPSWQVENQPTTMDAYSAMDAFQRRSHLNSPLFDSRMNIFSSFFICGRSLMTRCTINEFLASEWTSCSTP
jgi:hypothetical protein